MVHEHLLIHVENLVGVQVTQRGVRVSFGVRAHALRAVVAHVAVVALANRGRVAFSVVAAVIWASCEHTRCGEAQQHCPELFHGDEVQLQRSRHRQNYVG